MDKQTEFHKDIDKPRPLLVDPHFLSRLIEQLSTDAKNEDETHIMAASGVPYFRTDFIVEMARVLAYGAQEHGSDNWKKAPESEARDIYLNALMRHVLAYAKGIRYSKERQYHLAQIAVNAMFLFYFDKIGKPYEPADV